MNRKSKPKATVTIKKAPIRPYRVNQEIVYTGINGIPEKLVPEIKVSYVRGKESLGKVDSSFTVAEFFRKTFKDGTIELQECFVVLYLNQRNEVIGYYRHAVGGIAGVVADRRIIFAVALTSLATSIVLCHNHPSGSTQPSEPDKELTYKFQDAGKLLDIDLLDHIIIARTEYFSFGDNLYL